VSADAKTGAVLGRHAAEAESKGVDAGPTGERGGEYCKDRMSKMAPIAAG